MTSKENREAFRQCRTKWEMCRRAIDMGISRLSQDSPSLCSRKMEEYVADFERICKKALTSDVQRRALMRALHNDLPIGLEMTELMGAALIAVEPYKIFPPDDYFRIPIMGFDRRPLGHYLMPRPVTPVKSPKDQFFTVEGGDALDKQPGESMYGIVSTTNYSGTRTMKTPRGS